MVATGLKNLPTWAGTGLVAMITSPRWAGRRSGLCVAGLVLLKAPLGKQVQGRQARHEEVRTAFDRDEAWQSGAQERRPTGALVARDDHAA